MAHPLTDLRATLATASRAAYLHGATDSQINMIIALARGSGDYRAPTGGQLSKFEAKQVIDQMIQDGAEPEWSVTEAELDDQDAAAAANDQRAAYVKARKKQKKAEKAERESAALAAAMRNADGRQAKHGKYGVGTIIAEHTKTYEIAFPGQKKTVCVLKDFIEIV